jgi:secreted PhoX family phosphatase
MFKSERLGIIVSGAYLAFAASTPAMAVDTLFDNFRPLPSSATAGSLPESQPFLLSSPNFSQVRIADRATQVSLGQPNSGDWDMITANETGPSAGRYLFMPFETSTAGVQRIDLTTGQTRTIVQPGTQGFVSGDASRWAPWGGYLTAEESWGTGSTKGRLFEVTNPVSATGTGDSNFVQRTILPRVSHEGLAFDKNNNLYFIDELNGGGIYKYHSANPNATNGNDYFSAGQTFAMQVARGGNSSAVGPVTWAPITNSTGGALAGVSVLNSDGTIDGRATADVVGGTHYQRPEDMEIKTLPNGDQIVFVTTTTTHEVYSINLASNEVKVFADRNTIDESTGHAVGASFITPDNLGIDAAGNIYIVEDNPTGDIWFARDVNNDGVAESLGRWASLSTRGAEPTGLYFDKFHANVAYLNVQHPDSLADSTIMISAIPEPKALSMLIAGLGLICAIVRRRPVTWTS